MSTCFLFRGCPSHRGGTTLVTCVLPQVHLQSRSQLQWPQRSPGLSERGERGSLTLAKFPASPRLPETVQLV